jgi:hypothetical protein
LFKIRQRDFSSAPDFLFDLVTLSCFELLSAALSCFELLSAAFSCFSLSALSPSPWFFPRVLPPKCEWLKGALKVLLVDRLNGGVANRVRPFGVLALSREILRVFHYAPNQVAITASGKKVHFLAMIILLNDIYTRSSTRSHGYAFCSFG